MTFNPYNMAAEEEKKQAVLPLKLAKKGAILAASVAGAGGGLLKLLPFLSGYVPEKLARKGMARILPKTEKFFNQAEKSGHSFDEAREFIKEKLAPLTKKEEEPKPQNKQEAMTANVAKLRQRQPSELSAEGLMQQRGMNPTEDSGISNLANFGKGMTDDYYEKGWRSLKNGKTIVAGIDDPLLQAAKPYSDAGQINDPQDLKEFAQIYYQNKKNSQNQLQPQQQPNQGQAQGQGKADLLRTLQEATELLRRLRGNG